MRARTALVWTLSVALGGCSFISQGELREKIDVDGDGETADQDCDDADPTIGGQRLLYLDEDLDGFGRLNGSMACANDGNTWVEESGDCDDANNGVNPGAAELCNNVDDDCDGETDEAVADEDLTVWYVDEDGDGFGGPTIAGRGCTTEGGHVANSDDCDDADPTIGATVRWYRDRDDDGYGVSSDSVDECLLVDAGEEGPRGYVAAQDDGFDCDDDDPDVHPDAHERCDDDGVDEDCDGLVNDADDRVVDEAVWYIDNDGDGLGSIDRTELACDNPTVADDESLVWVANSEDCDDTVDDSEAPVQCEVADLSVGVLAWCTRMQNGRLTCGGYEDLERDELIEFRDGIVLEAPEDEPFKAVAVGLNHACAIDMSNHLRCWGSRDGSVENLSEPEGVFLSVDVENSHTCAVRDDYTVSCWGDGISYSVSALEGDDVEVARGLFEVSSGAAHSCALEGEGVFASPDESDDVDEDDDERVTDVEGPGPAVCFGSCSDQGECREPELASGGLSQIAAGREFSCGVLSGHDEVGDGCLLCWGDVPPLDVPGEWGDRGGSLWCPSHPVSGAREEVRQVTAALGNLCVRTESGLVRCGSNNAASASGDITWPDPSVAYRHVSIGAFVGAAVRRDGGEVDYFGLLDSSDVF